MYRCFAFFLFYFFRCRLLVELSTGSKLASSNQSNTIFWCSILMALVSLPPLSLPLSISHSNVQCVQKLYLHQLKVHNKLNCLLRCFHKIFIVYLLWFDLIWFVSFISMRGLLCNGKYSLIFFRVLGRTHQCIECHRALVVYEKNLYFKRCCWMVMLIRLLQLQHRCRGK